MTCPRRMLMYRGNSTVMSFAADSELAEMLVPRVVSIQTKDAKKAAARLSQWSINWSGSHSTLP